MSKEKKKKQTPDKELSEWQKRNQEYLQKKAEEEAKQKGVEARAEEKTRHLLLRRAIKNYQNGKSNIKSIFKKRLKRKQKALKIQLIQIRMRKPMLILNQKVIRNLKRKKLLIPVMFKKNKRNRLIQKRHLQ